MYIDYIFILVSIIYQIRLNIIYHGKVVYDNQYMFIVYLAIVWTYGKNKTLGSGMLLSVTTEIFIHTKLILYYSLLIILSGKLHSAPIWRL